MSTLVLLLDADGPGKHLVKAVKKTSYTLNLYKPGPNTGTALNGTHYTYTRTNDHDPQGRLIYRLTDTR